MPPVFHGSFPFLVLFISLLDRRLLVALANRFLRRISRWIHSGSLITRGGQCDWIDFFRFSKNHNDRRHNTLADIDNSSNNYQGLAGPPG